MKKRIISLLLIAVMLISMAPLGAITAFAEDISFVGGVKDYEVSSGEQGQESYTWLSLQQTVQNSGTLTLTNDVICDNQTYGPIIVPEGVDVTIDLNGYKIDRNLTTAVDNGAVIEVFGSLTVKDNSSAKTGIITGGYNTCSDGIMVAGGIQVDGGTLVLESGSITGCSSERHGAGVNIKNGIFIMNGGIISENRANSHGAGVCVTYGIFTMTDGIISENRASVGAGVYATNSDLLLSGGEISGNTANETGGGLNASGSANVTLTGCKITGNTAPKAGGVSFYLADYGNFSFNVGKNTMIIGNTDTNGSPSNLYLSNFNQKTMLTIMDGENAPNGMSIGISMKNTPTISNPIPVSDATMKHEYLYYFFSDNNNYSLSIMDDILFMTNEHTYIYGDVDHDGEVTILDVTLIQRYLASFDDKLTDEALLCCDADGNGKISILDCTHIQRYIAKLSCSDNVGKHFTI